MKTIPKAEWRWFGSPAHFICSFDCRFHLATQIGGFVVSTVGEYFPDAPVREILAASKGIKLAGRGDDRKYQFLREHGFEEIGCDRKYETMVFRAGKPCASKYCGCGLPEISGSELDMAGYNTKAEAERGHAEMCDRYAVRNLPTATGREK